MADTETRDPGQELRRLGATFRSGRTRPLRWRLEQLEAMRAMVVDHVDEMAEALSHDLGRPAAEAFGLDPAHVRRELDHLIDALPDWIRPRRRHVPRFLWPARAEVRYEPLGVVLVLAPWNFPFQLLLEPMAAALAAGNCVVGKPSELAPHCSTLTAELVASHLDTDAIAIVECDRVESRAWVDQPWDHLVFTGSTDTANSIMAIAARHLTPVTLELGGKSPAYVAADADLSVAARRIAWGKFVNAGQTCVAPDYVLVDRSVLARFLSALDTAVQSFYGDDPRASDSYSRIIDCDHTRRLVDLLERGGGTVLRGGHSDVDARYFAPTVVLEPDAAGPLMTEEIFGPILPVVTVADHREAAAIIAERSRPLSVYVFSNSDETVSAVLDATRSGGACVNHTLLQLLPSELPFGGVGESGTGRYRGLAGFETLSNPRSVLHTRSHPDLRLFYPPYSAVKLRGIRKLM